MVRPRTPSLVSTAFTRASRYGSKIASSFFMVGSSDHHDALPVPASIRERFRGRWTPRRGAPLQNAARGVRIEMLAALRSNGRQDDERDETFRALLIRVVAVGV